MNYPVSFIILADQGLEKEGQVFVRLALTQSSCMT